MTFYTADAFAAAVRELAGYGALRAQSIRGQLEGRIPATQEGQRNDPSTLIDPGELDLSLTIDFGGLAFGITAEEVCAILDAVFDGYEQADVAQLAADLQAEPGRILALIGRVFRSSRLLSGAVKKALTPPLLVIVSVAVLLIALRIIKRRGGRACS